MKGYIHPRIVRYEQEPVRLQTSHESVETTGSLSKYATCLGFRTLDDLDVFLKGKKILDISSGYDGFAVDALLKSIDCKIVSNNPGRQKKHFNQHRLKELRNHIDFCQYSYESIDAAIRLVDETATSYFAQTLSFPHDSFDTIIDNDGIFYYGAMNKVSQLYRAMVNMYEVVKPGGQILIGDRFFFLDDGRRPAWKEDLLKEMGIPYSPIHPDINRDPYGVVITKGY